MYRECGLEGGVAGNPVLTSDPGSPDQFNASSGTSPLYTATHPHAGNLCMTWPNETTLSIVAFRALGTLTGDVWSRFYLYLPSLPADDNFHPINYRNTIDQSDCSLKILSSGLIQMRDSTDTQVGSTGSTAVATGQWIRIETRSNVTTGAIEYWLYNSPEATSHSDTGSVSGATIGANISRVNFGTALVGVAAGITSFWDDVAVSDVSKIGPKPLPPATSQPTDMHVLDSRGTSW